MFLGVEYSTIAILGVILGLATMMYSYLDFRKSADKYENEKEMDKAWSRSTRANLGLWIFVFSALYLGWGLFF